MLARVRALLDASAGSASALRNRSVRRVMLGFFAYNAVEIGAWTAILIYAYGATGAASVGVIAVVQLVPSALLAPFLAGIGDRYARSRVLGGWYLAQAGSVAAIGVAIVAGVPAPVVYGLSTLATIALTQTRPVQAALLPQVVSSPDELTASNALASIGEGIGAFAGPLAVGILLAVASLGITFVAGGLSLLVAGLLVLGIPSPPEEPARDDDAQAAASTDAHEGGPFDLLAGLREVVRDGDLVVVMALLTGRLVIYGGLEVLVVLLALELLGIGESGAGLLLASLGLGTIAGGSAAFALVGRRRLAPWLGVGAIVVGLPIALVGLAPGSSTAVVLLAVCGVGLAVLDVAGQTLLQRITPDAVRARVFGVLEGLLLLGEAVGSIIVGPLVVVAGPQAAAVVLGLLLPAMAALAVVRFAAIDRRVVVPAVQLAALRRVAMLAPLGAPALEAVARHLVPVVVGPGSVLIREGEHGDRWYLVREGRLEVSAAGRQLRTLGPGDTFGEIALLHDVPRTATVIAPEGASLWALEREEFLAAVTRAPSALAEAQRLAAERKAGSDLEQAVSGAASVPAPGSPA